METRNVQCYEGFRTVGRAEMMTVEGGSLQGFVELVRRVIQVIQALGELSECVDDFIEGYKEGLEEARNS